MTREYSGSIVLPLALARSDGLPPEWVQLMPAGQVMPRDGREPWLLDDAAAVIAATRRRAGSTDLPIDYEHQSEFTRSNGQPALAAGWLVDLEARPNGIWGRVEWTERATAHIRAREYRYLSPTFRFERRSRRITALESAALTNLPALDLQALAKSGGTMDEEGKLAAVRTALELPEGATVDDTIARIRDLAGVDDPQDETVPVALLRQVVSEMASERAQMASERAEARVGDAVQSGKLPPSLREWGLALCAKDPAAFDQFIASMPQIVAPGSTGLDGSPPRGNGTGGRLSEEERAVCRNLGISEEAFIQQRRQSEC